MCIFRILLRLFLIYAVVVIFMTMLHKIGVGVAQATSPDFHDTSGIVWHTRGWSWARPFGFSLSGLAMTAVVCGTLLVMFFSSLLFGTIRNRDRRSSLSVEEGEMLEKLWKGVQKMEDRITNLETILISQHGEWNTENRM